MSNISVIILAGGAGTRFEPLKGKNLYPFLGEDAFDIHIKQLKAIDVKKTVVVTNSDFSLERPDVTFVKQQGNGMAGAVLTALNEIDPDSELLILNANDYYDDSLISNFAELRPNFLKNNEAALTGHFTEKYFPGGYLIIQDGYIKDIIEKPGEGNEPSNYVNIVFDYFPNSGTLKKFIEEAKSKKDDVYEVALDNMMHSDTKFRLLPYEGPWKTIKYPWHVLDVMDFFLKKIDSRKISPDASVSPHAFINGNVVIEAGVKVFDGAIIKGPCYISKDSIIANGALVRNSMIGENCVIGFATEVARSYIKNDVWLHKNYVGDSILEDNVSLGSNSVTGNLRLDEQDVIKEVNGQKVDTEKNKLGAIIGSDVRIGINVSIMPGVRIGSGSFVGPNVNLEKDLDENRFVRLVQDLEIRENKFDIKSVSRKDIKKNLDFNNREDR